MDSILVKGNGPLSGSIPIAGAKNACLTLMPATLLSDEPLTLTNAPRLSDIKTMTQLLQSLGAEVTTMQGGQVLAMSSHDLNNLTADYDIVRRMRASNLVLGPLLARAGRAIVSLPGGCAIGARPMDIHVAGLEALGARIVRGASISDLAAEDVGGGLEDLCPQMLHIGSNLDLRETLAVPHDHVNCTVALSRVGSPIDNLRPWEYRQNQINDLLLPRERAVHNDAGAGNVLDCRQTGPVANYLVEQRCARLDSRTRAKLCAVRELNRTKRGHDRGQLGVVDGEQVLQPVLVARARLVISKSLAELVDLTTAEPGHARPLGAIGMPASYATGSFAGPPDTPTMPATVRREGGIAR